MWARPDAAKRAVFPRVRTVFFPESGRASFPRRGCAGPPACRPLPHPPVAGIHGSLPVLVAFLPRYTHPRPVKGSFSPPGHGALRLLPVRCAAAYEPTRGSPPPAECIPLPLQHPMLPAVASPGRGRSRPSSPFSGVFSAVYSPPARRRPVLLARARHAAPLLPVRCAAAPGGAESSRRARLSAPFSPNFFLLRDAVMCYNRTQ